MGNSDLSNRLKQGIRGRKFVIDTATPEPPLCLLRTAFGKPNKHDCGNPHCNDQRP